MGGDSPPQAGCEGGALIDKKSIADYRQQVEDQRLLNRNATAAEIFSLVKEYIKKRLDGLVDEECRKRVMDLSTVALASLSSMVIPFSGVAVVVAATVIQCLNFSVTLGLIPVLNVRSFNDLVVMTTQIGSSIKRAGKSSLMAGVETAILEILKKLGLGDWLWVEILRGILIDMVGDSAMDAAWVMTPLLAAPKYMMHRHLVKKMYHKLGNKAMIVHAEWVERNCVTLQTSVVTQVAAGVQVDPLGNVQGSYIQVQEVCATQVVPIAAQPLASKTNGSSYKQRSPYSPSNQAPRGDDFYPALGMVPSSVQGYPPKPQPAAQPQQQIWPSASDANLFQPQSTAKPMATVIMGYAPPANSSFFQPQPAAKTTGTLIMGQTLPANSSIYQRQSGGQFPLQAGGQFQFAAAAVPAQISTPPPNPTIVQQLPPYSTQQAQQMMNLPKGQTQANSHVQIGE